MFRGCACSRLVSSRHPSDNGGYPIQSVSLTAAGPILSISIRGKGHQMNDQERTMEQLTAELTELRQRVAELAKTPLEEERFRKVFEEGPLGVVLLGLDVQIQRCNRRFCEMLDYSDDEIITLGLVGISHPADWPKDFQLGSRLLRGDIPNYTIDKRYVRKGGTIFWGRLTVSMMHDAKGQPTAVIGIIEDITQQKRAEEALRESEEHYRKLTESTTDMICIADRAGDILYANPSAVAAIGLDSGSIAGKRQNELFSPEMARRHIGNIEKVFATGEVSKTDGVYHFGSEDIWLNTCLIPLRDEYGQVTSVMGVSRNITERKAAEAALQKAHKELEQKVAERTVELTKANEELAMFRRFVETARQGFAMAGLDGHITYVNPAISRVFAAGRSVAIIGSHVSRFYPKEYMERREKEVLPQIVREGHWQGEVAFSLPNRLFTCLQDSFLVRDERGEPAYLATVFTDITERKQAEEALRREHRTLKYLLQASDHERQVIAYEIHDELAQQLAGAIMQFETYSHQKDAKPKEAAKAFAAGMTMLQQGHFEARRLIAGVRPPILDESGVLAAVAHLVNEQNRLNGPNIEYCSRATFDRLAPIVENSIYRIVQEGLTNACQHSKSERVRVSIRQRDDHIRIEIRDWGVGFDPKRRGKGCYGLAGIRQRARLLGGKCSIQSKAGKGTWIAVEMPVVETE